ncbi:CCCH zinc finger and SMR domain-containing protein [Histoplasma capsulatum var. duboisii H88]|uniref:CCCH zinc finger and SMR domain-containing protein n=1 Tax=Ajellomyces capsulatus (strain H88) TaxID=544711 RepID=F0U5Z5_AJEC8|nr:CCCH zinc finger and SMR domain-containing protein [Histoplasma capsulatum var. duboisii H88]
MVPEEIYEICLPILEDGSTGEEEKAEKLELLLREKVSLLGSSLENAILDVLWRHRSSTKPDSSPPLRHTVIRRASPAPWQIPRASTPLSPPSNSGTSPAAPPGFPVPRGGFPRAPRSLTASPFTSPRPSPRLALAHPIPHSPSLSAYEFSDQTSAPEIYGDLGSDNVDWLVNDDARSVTPSTGVSGAAPEWAAPPDMSPYDILRSVLGNRRTNEDIEQALEANGYDLGATIAVLANQEEENAVAPTNEARILVGKSMAMDQMRPVTLSTQTRSPVVCKYWLSTGQCLRADCRFSHDLTGHICKYWLQGSCLAGDGCPFSHDPSTLVGALTISSHHGANMGGFVDGFVDNTQPAYQFQDNYDSFPALQPSNMETWPNAGPYQRHKHTGQYHGTSSPNFRNKNSSLSQASRPHSRPTSRHQNHELNPAALSVDDPEAFPTLSAVKGAGKKHHGKRGNGHHRDHSGHKENNPSSLADVVRMSPSPAPGHRKGTPKSNRTYTTSRENSAAAQAIPTPKHIPWLETGNRVNQQYLKYRHDAITHGNVRNKFLQRNDARAAKALSLRGQAENEAMRRAHREAARHLYEERNKHLSNSSDDELYVDLHGLHPSEAIEYLENILLEHAKLGRRVLYAITGTGHHSKNGKDKVGKAVKAWLNEWRYVFREFSVPGERGGYIGGVLGIDPTSYDRNAVSAKSNGKGGSSTNGDRNNQGTSDENSTTANSSAVLTMGKIQLLKREDSGTNEK